MSSKLMSAEEAIARFVHDGDSVHMGQITEAFGLAREVVRQRKRDLTFICAGHGVAGLFTTLGGCSRKAITAYMWGELVPGPLREMVQRGELKVEDYTNQTITLMLMAGAMGMPFVTTRSLLGTDYIALESVPQPGGFLGDQKLKVIDSPFDGRPVVLLPAMRPKVCLTHVQWADAEGNAVFWGGLGDNKWGSWAAERVIVSAEEIVPTEVIRSHPQQVTLPGLRVSAVVHMPWGAVPTPLAGYYRADYPLIQEMIGSSSTAETLEAFFGRWVYGCPTHEAFLALYRQRFGADALEILKPNIHVEPVRSISYGFDP